MEVPIPDRAAAGRELARLLDHLRGRDDLIVLALPRGGVPVAAEIAAALGAPLDVMLVRKLGVPGFPELAMGAIASGGVRVLNEDVIRSYRIADEAIAAVAREEQAELERRERLYRGDRPWPPLQGRWVVLVDDGLATGATMKAAIQAVRAQSPAGITVAVPVAPPETVRALKGMVDEVVCPLQPKAFYAIGQWYLDFSQTSDQEVREILAWFAAPAPSEPAAPPWRPVETEIPADERASWLQSFALAHHGWLADVVRVPTDRLEREGMAAAADGEVLARELPLKEIDYEAGAGGGRLRLVLGTGGARRTVEVADLTRLLGERLGEADAGLRADGADGGSVLLRFRAPARPEALDGLSASELDQNEHGSGGG